MAATIIFKAASVTVNSVDLSNQVRGVTLSMTPEEFTNTKMDPNGRNSHSRTVGLLNWQFEVTFEQDFSTGSVDATLFNLIGASAFSIDVLPSGAAASGANPHYSGQVVLSDYNPIDGSVGEPLEVTATFLSAGDITRSTV